MNPWGGGCRISPSIRRIAGTGAAVSAFALGLAAHARAADVTAPVAPVAVAMPTAPTAPAVPTVASVPTVPQAPASVTAAQTAPANVVIQIRIDSPGDNGAVTQTITAAATDAAAQQAAAAAVPASAPAPDPAPAATVAAQAAPANVDLSVRMASPGANGESTQAITATATQYQPAAAAAPAAAPSPDPAPATPAPGGAAASASAAGLPSSWTWNWTCGDIGPGDIASTSDITSQGWIWNWNLGTDCGGIDAGNQDRKPSSVEKSAADIVVAPTAPEIVLPTPPVLPAPTPPVPPSPVLERGALGHRARAVIAQAVPAAPLEASGGDATPPPRHRPSGPRPPAERHEQHLPLGSKALSSSGEPPAASSGHATAHRSTAPAPSHAGPASRPVRTLPVPADLDVASAGSGGAAGAGGGSGGGSSAVTAALALWLLLLLPALAVMRLPRNRRGPDAQVGDVLTRPG